MVWEGGGQAKPGGGGHPRPPPEAAREGDAAPEAREGAGEGAAREGGGEERGEGGEDGVGRVTDRVAVRVRSTRSCAAVT